MTQVIIPLSPYPSDRIREVVPAHEMEAALRAATFALESAVMLQGLAALAPAASAARAILDRLDGIAN